MVHELTLQAVQIKINIIDPPARLINHKELSCAIGMGYKQAGLSLPKIQNGKPIEEFKRESTEILKNNLNVKDNVKFVIEHYILQTDEVMDEDGQIAMRLGYNAE